MKEKKEFMIIDVSRQQALYGIEGASLIFSERRIADEVASQFFKLKTEYIVVFVKTKI